MGEIEKQKASKSTIENYEFQPKDSILTMRISSALLDKVKERAKQKNIDYQKYVRMILEEKIKED